MKRTEHRPLLFPNLVQKFDNLRHYPDKRFQSCVLRGRLAFEPFRKEGVDLRIPTCRFADEEPRVLRQRAIPFAIPV